MYKILCVGPQWRGSNAAALFKAFGRLGHAVVVVDENYYINLSNHYFLTKALDKLFFGWHAREFNDAVSRAIALFAPDLIVVYKGAFIHPDALKQWKKTNTVVNVYPDVSFRTHGARLPHTLPLYDWVFTTKTFGLSDMKKELGVANASFIPHGFDPDIHRILLPEGRLKEELSCEVSFIGTHSPKKERYLTALIEAIPELKLKVWGNGWQRATSKPLLPHIVYKEVLGDLYAMAIHSSSINLGILSEKVGGASQGDQITSRTFHIPASGGFMLHERTPESVLYYAEDEEAAFFQDEKELIRKVRHYLSHPEERAHIRSKGRERALRDHAIDHRAAALLNIMEEKVWKRNR